MKTSRDTPRSTMTDEEMIKDYPRLRLEYTRLHEDYREAIRKPLTTPRVVRFSECKCDEDCMHLDCSVIKCKQGNKK